MATTPQDLQKQATLIKDIIDAHKLFLDELAAQHDYMQLLLVPGIQDQLQRMVTIATNTKLLEQVYDLIQGTRLSLEANGDIKVLLTELRLSLIRKGVQQFFDEQIMFKKDEAVEEIVAIVKHALQ